MTFIKLCEPKLEQSVDALIERVSALEKAVKSGVSVNIATNTNSNSNIKADNGATVDSKNSEKVDITPISIDSSDNKNPADIIRESLSKSSENTPVNSVAKELKVEKTYQTDASQETIENNDYVISNEKIDDMPFTPPVEPVFEPPVQEATVEEPQQTAPPQSSVKVEFDRWGEFMDELAKHDMPMFALLSGSKAYVRGNTFIIQSTNKAVAEILKSESHAKSIKKALFDVTGIEYQTKLAKPKVDDKVKRDPLEDLINNIQGNVDLDLK